MSWIDPEHMECPCLCDCGNWFEVTDGYPRPDGDKGLVCSECYEELNAE